MQNAEDMDMHKNKEKNKLKYFDNESSMMLLIAFFVLCLIIASVIGIYSVKKNKQENASGRSSEQEFVQTSSDGYETVNEGKENHGTASSTERETAETDRENTSDIAKEDIIFEGCGQDGVLVTMIRTGGWGDENAPFLQYDIVITNTSGTDISEWCITIKTGTDAACNNIWNGSAELEKGVLVITPADFNGTIVSGTQTSIGIIIEKPGELEFEDVIFK